MSTIPSATTSLTTLPTKELQARFLAAFGQSTPSRNRPWLIRRLQAIATPMGRMRRPTASARASVPKPRTKRQRPTDLAPATAVAATVIPQTGPAIGSEIRRAWRGQTLVVTVREDGFHLNGAVYRSLSAAATAICGSNRNGLVFFGLKPHPGKAACATPSAP